MSDTYFNFYKRIIMAKSETEDSIKQKVNDAHNKGRLTDLEYEALNLLIEEVYEEN